MKETWFQYLGQKDPLEKGMATHSSGDCSHEIKRHLLIGWKALTKLDSILKNRHHFANKGPYSQNYSFL